MTLGEYVLYTGTCALLHGCVLEAPEALMAPATGTRPLLHTAVFRDALPLTSFPVTMPTKLRVCVRWALLL